MGAVGLIYNATLTTKVMESGQANAVLIAREFSRNPNFVLDVAKELGVKVKWPIQLHRAEPVR
jgi:2,4-dienoyl-CoA reductase-like NADH-dependent reductase (Old Yellow Enzyme family)